MIIPCHEYCHSNNNLILTFHHLGLSETTDSMNNLSKLVAQYEEVTTHETLTILDKRQQRSFDEIKTFGDQSLVYREEETIHIITRKEHMAGVKKKILDKAGIRESSDSNNNQSRRAEEEEFRSGSYR